MLEKLMNLIRATYATATWHHEVETRCWIHLGDLGRIAVQMDDDDNFYMLAQDNEGSMVVESTISAYGPELDKIATVVHNLSKLVD